MRRAYGRRPRRKVFDGGPHPIFRASPARGGSLLASLPPALAAAVLVAALLAVFGAVSRRYPNPLACECDDTPTQGVSMLALACVVLSAAVPLACFLVAGSSYPVFDFVEEPPAEQPPLMATVAAYLAICAAVAFYEEGAFRVILQDLFERGFAGNGARADRCRLYAAVLASALFAALHAFSPAASDADGVQVAAQAILKFSQGMLFGMAMAGLLAKTGSFALIIGIHTCYDLLFFLPWMLTVGAFPATYLTGLPIDTWALAANCACLVAPAALAVRQLVCGGAVQRRLR